MRVENEFSKFTYICDRAEVFLGPRFINHQIEFDPFTN